MEIVTKEMFDQFAKEIAAELKEIKEMINQNQPKKFIKNKDLKDYLGCSYSTIDKMREGNVIPYKKVMGNYYYSVEDVNRVFSGYSHISGSF